MTPLHRRIALIVRSRFRRLGAAAVLTCVVALLAIFANDGGFLLLMIGAAIGYTAIPLAMAASHRELTGAEAGLWLQKPVREVSFVLVRFVETLAATVGLSLLFGALCVGVAALAGWSPDGGLLPTLGWDPVEWALLSTLAGALASFTMAAIAFGATAWLERGAAAFVVFLILFSIVASTWSSSAPEGTANWLQVSRFAFFPSREFLALTGALIGTRSFEAQFVTVPLAYSAAWVAVGILGVRLSVKRGHMGYDRAA